MTKKQIIEKLQNAAKPYEEYYIDEDLINAINQYPEPFELVEPILCLIILLQIICGLKRLSLKKITNIGIIT